MQEKNKKAIFIKSNKENLDFKKIKESGIDAVIFKVSYGLNPYKKELKNNIKKAKESGLLIGVYKELNEKGSANLQALLYSRILKKYKLDLYPILSIESNKNNLNKKEFSDKCLKFMEIVKKYINNECVIKTSTSFANDNLDMRLRDNKFWSIDEDKSMFKHNKIWDNWDCFKCNKKHTISGINNKFELGEIKNTIIKNKFINDTLIKDKCTNNNCNCGHSHGNNNCSHNNCGHNHCNY